MRLFTIILVSGFIISCKKEVVTPPVELPVYKQAHYHLYAAKDYSEPSFQNIEAQVRLQLRKINYRTGASELLWDSTLASRKLPDFPQEANKILISKTVPVLESSEKLNASYSILYKDGNLVHQYGESKEAVPGTMSVLLTVQP